MVNLFEGVPEEVINKTLETIRANLGNVGLYGGHTVNRHVDVQELKLRARLTTEDLKFATSYYDFRTARAVVAGLMKAYYERSIKGWLLSKGEDALSLYGKFGKSIGYGYKKGSGELAENLTEACLVLVKDEEADWGFRIKTSYPVYSSWK